MVTPMPKLIHHMVPNPRLNPSPKLIHHSNGTQSMAHSSLRGGPCPGALKKQSTECTQNIESTENADQPQPKPTQLGNTKPHATSPWHATRKTNKHATPDHGARHKVHIIRHSRGGFRQRSTQNCTRCPLRQPLQPRRPPPTRATGSTG